MVRNTFSYLEEYATLEKYLLQNKLR